MKRGKRKLVILLSVVLPVSLALLFLNYYLFQRVKMKSEEIREIRGDLHLLSQRFKSLSLWRSTLRGSEGDLEKLEGVFVNPDNPLPLIDELEETAARHGVEINVSNIGFEEKATLRLNVGGAYQGCMRFLSGIENFPYLSNVEELTISSPQKGEGEGTEVEMSMKVNFLTHEED